MFKYMSLLIFPKPHLLLDDINYKVFHFEETRILCKELIKCILLTKKIEHKVLFIIQ